VIKGTNSLEVVPHYVARYWDLIALADRQPVNVSGADAVIRDRPGFEVDFITRNSISSDPIAQIQPEILMPVKSHWRLSWDGGRTVLNSGDTAFLRRPAELPLGAVRGFSQFI